jgi:hypothetical protein
MVVAIVAIMLAGADPLPNVPPTRRLFQEDCVR